MQNDEVELCTIEEAFEEFDILRRNYEKWVLRTLHLNVAAVLLCDDMQTHPGYMSFTGNKDRVQMMFDHVHAVRQLGDDSCKKTTILPQPPGK